MTIIRTGQAASLICVSSSHCILHFHLCGAIQTVRVDLTELSSGDHVELDENESPFTPRPASASLITVPSCHDSVPSAPSFPEGGKR